MPRTVLLVHDLSRKTRSSDLKHVFAAAGTVYDIERDYEDRSALIEFKRSSGAKYAWDNFNGKCVDGREICVDWASKADFRRYGWRQKNEPSPTPERFSTRSSSPSRSPASSY